MYLTKSCHIIVFHPVWMQCGFSSHLIPCFYNCYFFSCQVSELPFMLCLIYVMYSAATLCDGHLIWGLSQCKGISVLKIRRSCYCLLFNMGFPIPGKTAFILRWAPGHTVLCKQTFHWVWPVYIYPCDACTFVWCLGVHQWMELIYSVPGSEHDYMYCIEQIIQLTPLI